MTPMPLDVLVGDLTRRRASRHDLGRAGWQALSFAWRDGVGDAMGRVVLSPNPRLDDTEPLGVDEAEALLDALGRWVRREESRDTAYYLALSQRFIHRTSPLDEAAHARRLDVDEEWISPELYVARLDQALAEGDATAAEALDLMAVNAWAQAAYTLARDLLPFSPFERTRPRKRPVDLPWILSELADACLALGARLPGEAETRVVAAAAAAAAAATPTAPRRPRSALGRFLGGRA